MQKYTVFIKPLTTLSDKDSEALNAAVREVMRHRNSAQVGANEFEIEVADDNGLRIGAWNALKNATDDKAFLVWYRHENKGITASSFPEGFDAELQESLRTRPHDRLQVVREVIRAIV